MSKAKTTLGTCLSCGSEGVEICEGIIYDDDGEDSEPFHGCPYCVAKCNLATNYDGHSICDSVAAMLNAFEKRLKRAAGL